MPLAYAMDTVHYRRETYRRHGRPHPVDAIDYAGHHIWGATAAMLVGLARRVALL